MPRAPRLSQRDLDEEFENFLKESLSDDSMETSGNLSKYHQRSAEKKKKDDSTPWWMKDDDDDTLKSGRGKRKSDNSDAASSTPASTKWLKPKKQSTPLREVDEEDVEEEADGNVARKRDEKEQKPKSDVKYGDPTEPSKPLQRQISRDSLEDERLDYKSQDSRKRSGVIPEQASFEDTYSYTDPSGGLTTPGSTGPDPLGGLTTPGSTGPGAETLEEMADKSRFFKELEAKAGGRIDYSRLNKEADLSGTIGTLPSAYMGSPDDDTGPPPPDKEEEQIEDKPVEFPSHQDEGKDKSSMLSKVALLDTVDSTLHPSRYPAPTSLPQAGGQGDAASSSPGHFLRSGTAGLGGDTRALSTGTTGELEALHAALRQAADTPTLNLPDMDDSVAIGTKKRTVDDIIREVNAEKSASDGRDDTAAKKRSSSSPGRGEARGFDLRPANQDAEPRGFDVQPANQDLGVHSYDDVRSEPEASGFDLSPVAEALEPRGFALQPAAPMSRGFDLQPASAADQESIDTAPQDNSKVKKATRKRSPSKPKGRYGHIRSSGYGQPKPDGKAAWSPADVARRKVKGSGVPALNGGDNKSEHHLLASVESFATYLHEQFADMRTTPPPELKHSRDEPILSASLREAKLHTLSRERVLVAEVNEWQRQWQEERRLNAKLKAEMAAVRREYARREEELRLAHEKEIFQAKQDNYVLLAKLNSQDDQEKARKRDIVYGKTPEGVSLEEQLKLMQREVVQQETLLQGYQQENERLYSEVKKLHSGNRENEERMFRENQKLQTDLGNMRELLEMKERALKNKGIITGLKMQQEIAAGNTAVLGAGKIAELQAEMKEQEIRQASLRAEVKQLGQGRRELEEHIEQLVREKTRAQEKINNMREVKQKEFQDLQVKYQREMEALQRKIRWYTENQDLLDRDTAALREKDDEIGILKEKLENGAKQSGSKTTEAQRRAKDRAADAKRIQDLERQVREMNDIIRRRHPNSLPALIYAAASAPSSDLTSSAIKGQRSLEHGQSSPEGQPRSIAFLENKLRRLEAELEGKEEENSRALRVVEQKYNAMKVRYEDRINTLEAQLEEYEAGKRATSRPHTSVAALEKELESVKERNKRHLLELEKENGDLRRKLAKAVSSAMEAAGGGGGEGSKGRKTERDMTNKELQMALSQMALELGARDKELALLRSTCDKLMEERFHMWSVGESSKAKTKKGKKSAGKPESTPPDAQATGGKLYEPQNFAGSHISDVLVENERLKQQVEDISLEMEQQRVRLHASLAEAESATRQAKEKAGEEVAAMRSLHQAEIERLVADRVLSQADSRMARLTSQVQSQQVMIRELQEQLTEARLEIDRLSTSRVRERMLQTQVEQVQEELREAKKSHSPEMRHFEALQAKITALESRHIQRDRDLHLLVERAARSATADKEQEIFHLRESLASKNMEIQRFRVELEAILEVLRELQRQGVVLPLDSQVVHSML